MIALAGVTIHSKIYESSTSLVYRGRSEQDNRAIAPSALPEVIVDILGKIHAANIVYKDISPGNIMQWRSRLLAALSNNGQLIIDAIPENELIIGKQPAVPEMGAIKAQNRFN
jgi:predicted ATPase